MAAKKVVIVTGASSGIGLWTAVKFAQEGWITYATLRNVGKQDELKKVLEEKNLKDKVHTIELDATKDETVKKAIAHVLQKEGHIDAVVNNAGAGFLGSIESFSDEDLHKQYDVNVYGVVRVIRAVLPHFRERKAGRIVNVSSVVGTLAHPFNAVYSSTKFAVEALSVGLHDEVAPFGVKVVVVEPGFTKTNFGGAITHSSIKIPGDPYKSGFDTVVAVIQEGLKNAAEATVVADTIFKATTEEKPQFRYQCTPGDAAVVASVLKEPTGLNKGLAANRGKPQQDGH